jgi:uncharacterized membrane protein YkvA (DUF1232 family)
VEVLLGLVVLLVVLVASWLLLIAVLWLHRPSRELVGPALRLVPDLVRLVRSLLADPGTPRPVRVALVGLLAYLVMPLDLIPDFLPGIGSLDDVIIVAVVLRWTARRIGAAGLRSHWSGSDAGFALLCRLSGVGPS